MPAWRSTKLRMDRCDVGVPYVFLSYRRDDSIAHTGRIYDWLTRQLGEQHVFLDNEKIPAGVSFPEFLEARICASDVVLPVIGKVWATVEDPSGVRIMQPNDYVRMEIEGAFRLEKRVIPILVGEAKMPKASELPASLAALPTLNAVRIRDDTFSQDFERLVDEILQRPRNFVERELDRLRRIVFVLKSSAVTTPLLMLALLLAGWMSLFDGLGLDSLAAGLVASTAESWVPSRSESPVLLVTIDALTERALGRELGSGTLAEWRRDHARIIDRASQGGAAAVVFDLFFEREIPEADEKIAAAVRRAKARPAGTRVIFGARTVIDGAPKLSKRLAREGAWGSLCLVRRLGRVILSPLIVLDEKADAWMSEVPAGRPSLALAAAASAAGYEVEVADRKILVHGSIPPQRFRFSRIERVRFTQGPCRALALDDEVAMLFIRPSPPGFWEHPDRTISYATLLSKEASRELRLEGRILLVGVRGLLHEIDTQEIVEGWVAPPRKVPGVELHADALTSLIQDDVVSFASMDLRAVTLGAMALAGTLLSLLTSTLAPWKRRMALGAAVAGYLAIALALAAANLLLAVTYDLAAIIGAYGLLRWMEQRTLRTPLRKVQG